MKLSVLIFALLTFACRTPDKRNDLPDASLITSKGTIDRLHTNSGYFHTRSGCRVRQRPEATISTISIF